MSQRVVLIRHGETEWSRDHRHTGRTDVPLTEAGRRQAAALRDRLADRGFERVLVSPLERAVETSILAGMGDQAEARPELMELDYGEAEGLTTAQMREQTPGWTVWTHPTPGAETLAEAAARLEPLIGEIRGAEGDVALVAHAHILRVLTALWIGLPPSSGALFVLHTGSLSTLGWERETAAILAWNC